MEMFQTENNQIKISIIIPVYNAEKYLKKCLNSIRFQSYKNLEIILVDDGSKDTSSVICDKYAASDSRFISIHVQNGGVSKARNIGIENSRGEFLMFVDSDDWLQENAVELLIDKICQDRKIDFVAGSYYDICNGNRKIKSLVARDIEIEQKEIPKFCKDNYLLFTTPWAKMYRKNIIKEHGLLFDTQVKYGEDLIFNMHYLKYCASLAVLKAPVYNYQLMVVGSAQTRYFPDMSLYRIKGYISVCELVGEETQHIAMRFLSTGIGHYGNHIREESSYAGISSLINYFSDRVGYKYLKMEFGYLKGKLIYKKSAKILYYLMLVKNYIRRNRL